MEDNSDKISIFLFTILFTEKNPNEYLNCDLKYELSENPSPRNQEQLKNNLESHMKMFQENKSRVIKYFIPF